MGPGAASKGPASVRCVGSQSVEAPNTSSCLQVVLITFRTFATAASSCIQVALLSLTLSYSAEDRCQCCPWFPSPAPHRFQLRVPLHQNVSQPPWHHVALFCSDTQGHFRDRHSRERSRFFGRRSVQRHVLPLP